MYFVVRVFYSHLLPDRELRWTILQISQSKKLCNSVRVGPTKRANTGQHPSQHSLVFIHLTYTCTEARSTIGAVAVTLKMAPGAMASASGSSPDSDPSLSMSQNQVTLSYAIASYRQTLPSAVVLISICTDGVTETIEVSGPSGPFSVSGAPSPTGCSPSTSETLVV